MSTHSHLPTLAPSAIDSDGTVYLLHFDRPYRHARHYCGWTTDLPARLGAHQTGRGPRLIKVITGAGIGYRPARTWPGSRTRERQIKRQGGLSRCCPLCGVTPRRPSDLGRPDGARGDRGPGGCDGPWCGPWCPPDCDQGTTELGSTEWGTR